MRKTADVTPFPKKKSVQLLEKDVRPISLAPAVPKVAEGFILDDYVKPLVREGARSQAATTITTLALISMLQHWSLWTDGNGSTVRTLLFDYRRAFDFIDHSIVITKLYTRVVCQLGFRLPIWSIAGNQISRGLFFWVGSVPSGVTKGTKLGP